MYFTVFVNSVSVKTFLKESLAQAYAKGWLETHPTDAVVIQIGFVLFETHMSVKQVKGDEKHE